MAYNTALYLFLFLPAVLIIYQLMPQKTRWAVLLLSGYIFFWLVSERLIVYILGTTTFTYSIGRYIALQKQRCSEEIKKSENTKATKQKYKLKEKRILLFGITAVLAVLVYLKYYNFFVTSTNMLFSKTGHAFALNTKSLLLPIGISFYTLQAIGYMVDVYWGKIDAEKNIGKVALFLCFFPQIMEGPISMYSQTATSLMEGKSLTAENLSQGCIRIFWGLFKKIIIADRLYVFVHVIFENFQNYSGIIIVAGAIAYTIQLYMEFSGCMDIVIGSGKLFGIKLPENFRQPFFSNSASEFWNRWHITLGAWFKTYIFYPMSVSKGVKKWNNFGKKHFNKYITKLGISAICLFPVWLCNGLWHGARWSYIFYGMYYFVILLSAIALEPVKEKIINAFGINENSIWWNTIQILKTWIIIFIGEMFFRANGLKAGILMFKSIFTKFEMQKLNIGLDNADYIVIVAGCIVVAIAEIIKERNMLGEKGIYAQCLPIRWALYYSLIFAVIIFGAYGIGYQQVDLIYAGF